MSLPSLVDNLGSWTGSWKTFLQPDTLFDGSPLSATVTQDGDSQVIEYSGTIGDDDVAGTLRWVAGGSLIDWIDSWHTAGEPTRLEGLPPSFQYGDDEPWTWDIEIAATAKSITITHHNAGPGIPRYVGVVMELER